MTRRFSALLLFVSLNTYAHTFEVSALSDVLSLGNHHTQSRPHQYEVQAAWHLPKEWHHELISEFQISALASWGRLDFYKDGSRYISLGAAASYPITSEWETELGFKIGWLDDPVSPGFDLGGHYQMFSHLAFRYRWNDHWATALKYNHISNGNLDTPNPGLDMMLLEIGYSFK